MPGENHMIRVPWSASGHTRTRSVYQYDYGQVLSLEGFPEGMLPEIFEMHFSSDGGRSVSVLGKNGEVSVPDICLRKWQAVKAPKGEMMVKKISLMRSDVKDGKRVYKELAALT